MDLPIWVINGRPVVDSGGHPIECVVCPCGPALPLPCCVGTTPQHLWAYIFYGTYRSVGPPPTPGAIPPYACSALTLCKNWLRSDPGTDEHFYGYEIVDFYFDVADGTPAVFKSFLGCWPIRIRNTCFSIIGGFSPTTLIGIDYYNVGDFTNEVAVATDSIVIPCQFTNFGCVSAQINSDDSFYAQPYITNYDPTGGIQIAGVGTIPITILFSVTMTLSGTPTLYTAELTFSPGDTFIEGELCLQWIGCFTDCIPQTVWVEVSYDGSTNWTLEMTEDANTGFLADNHVIFYQSPSFPTSGTGTVLGTSLRVCDDGIVPAPWSITT